MRFVLLLAFSLVMAMPVMAEELSVQGKIELEGRLFFKDSSLSGQKDGTGLSVLFEPEFDKKLENGDELAFTPMLRIDPQDDRRTHVDIREAYWLHRADDWELQIGNAIVFWGVTESQHLVDIINSTDLVDNPDGEEKLGQPMVQLGKFTDVGDFSFYWLPVHRQQTFPGSEGRLRSALVVDENHANYTDGAGRWRQSFAARWKHYFGPLDVGVAHFHGVDRAPRLVQSGNLLVPTYDVIDQTSLDLQLTKDAWLWKFEGITRSGQGERFNAMAAGFEYTFFGIGETSQDLGVLLEYHKDDRGPQAPGQLFQDDIFVGARWVANNVEDTEFLAGMVVDRLSKDRAFSIEAQHRLSDNWDVELEARVYAGKSNGEAATLGNEDFMLLRFNRYF